MKLCFIRIVALCVLFLLQLYAHCSHVTKNIHARTFLYTRPFYDYLFLERLFNRLVNYTKGKLYEGLSIIGSHQQSTHNKKTTRYFLGDDRDEILVAGDNTMQKNTREFRAEWIGLSSDFFAIFTIKPKQKQDGGSIEWLQQLSKFTDHAFFSDCYIRILLPFYSARNHIEFVVSGNRKQELLQAFNNDTWSFAHITDQIQQKIALAKVVLACGSKHQEERLTLLYEIMIAIPAGNKQNAYNLFQPVIGSNKHVEMGLRFGIDYGLCSFEKPVQIYFFVDLQGDPPF